MSALGRGRGGKGGHEPRGRIRAREIRAVELAIEGFSQHQIAAELEITQAAVSKILQRVDERVLRELQGMVERQKVRHDQRLERLYAESLRAWVASKADATRRRQRKTEAAGGSGRGGGTLAELVVENRHGDPRYLSEARKVLADHRALWGLDAPQKLDVRTSGSPYAAMTEEELREELDRQTRLLSVGAVSPSDNEENTPPSSGEDEDAETR